MGINKKTSRRVKIKAGIRKKIRGTNDRPRLTVFRSNKEIYAQIINDDDNLTLLGASSRSKELGEIQGSKIEVSRQVGLEIARRAKEAGIETVVFDRNGFKYHGRIKALADGVREGGIIF
jgi:large subunit ribosomal protein L18